MPTCSTRWPWSPTSAATTRGRASYAQRAVEARESDPRLWFNGGLANAAAGRTAAARRAFERVLALQPGHAGALQWLARLPA